jgi:hypothetical protein
MLEQLVGGLPSVAGTFTSAMDLITTWSRTRG